MLSRLRGLNRRAFVTGVAVLGAVVLAILWIFTDVLRPPRSVVARALTNLARPADLELRFLVDIRADPAKVSRTEYHHLHFRAGPGPFLRPENARVQVQFPFQLLLERRGLTLNFRGQTIVREGAGYVRLSELPPFKQLTDTLEGRWLQVSDRQEGPGRALQPQEARAAARQFLARDVATDVRRGRSASIRGARAREYHLTVDEGRLRDLLRQLPSAVPDHPGVALAARFLDARLETYRIEQFVLWIRPRVRTIARMRLALVPRDGTQPVQRVVVDATILPRIRPGQGGEEAVGGVPEAPAWAVRLRPETLRLLLPR